MAFTFIVEDGTGLSNATSYTSLAFADEYLCQNLHAYPDWSGLTPEAQEQLLSFSSLWLDRHVQWKGTKSVPTSCLRWPRTGVCDRDGILIAEDEIPKQLQQATAELARYFISSDFTAFSTSSTPGASGELKELKVDVVELVFNVEQAQSGTSVVAVFPPEVKFLIDGLER